MSLRLYVACLELLGASLSHATDVKCIHRRLRPPVQLVDCVSTTSTCLHPSPALFRATTYSRGRCVTCAVVCVVVM